MLDSLRAFAKSWPGKIMGGFLLVGIAGFGINNVITDLGSNNVARVGSQDISSRDFLRAYQSQMNRVAQQIGSVPTAAEAMSLGVPTMVLQNLAQDAALDQMSQNFGLGVSENKLGDMLREDPNFAGTLGTFDPSNFQQVLQFSGLTEAEYFEDQSNVARRQQLVLSLFGDIKLPETASALVNRYIGDKRTVDYVVIGDTNVPTPAAPTEADLTAYLTEHQSEFRTVETRTVQMLALSPQILADSKTISDDAIAAEYERTKANLVTPERRTIQQVVLATPEQIAAFEAGLTAGTSFEDLVTQNALTPTDLGTLAQTQVTDPSLATAAFGLAQGGFVIIDGVTGKRAVHVSAIEAGGQTSLADARDGIANTLALAEARADYGDVLDEVEGFRAGLQPLADIASRLNIDLYEVPLTSSGNELSIVTPVTDADRSKVVQAVFKAEVGKLTSGVTLAGNATLWFDVTAIEPARDQTLDEVRDQVVAAWTGEQINDAITAETESIVTQLQGGAALADVAASLSIFPQLSQPFTRSGEVDTSIDQTVAGVVFAGGPDHVGSAVNAAGEHIVFQVVEVTPAEGPLQAQSAQSLDNEARIGIYGDFVVAVRDEARMTINQQALQQTLALNTGQ